MGEYREQIMNKIGDVLVQEVIGVLSSTYSDIYSVSRDTGIVTCHQTKGMIHGVRIVLDNGAAVDTAMNTYIANNVYIEDRDRLREMTDIRYMTERLLRTPFYTVHFRIDRNGEIHYVYVKIAREEDNPDFKNIIVAFGFEDDAQDVDIVSDGFSYHGVQKKRTILIVEDNEINREILKEILIDEYEVIEAENGLEGFEILHKRYRDISVVLLDIMMPVMDGYDFLAKVRDDVLLSAVPVMVLTSDNKQETEEKCMSLGALEFLHKPFNSLIVHGRIKNIIRMRETSMTLHAIEFDEVTDMYTKQAFSHHARALIDNNPDKSYSIIVADLDNFKMIKNVYGDNTGTEVLKFLGIQLKSRFPYDIVARYSSEQMVVLARKDTENFTQKIKSIFDEILKDAPINKMNIKVGVYNDVDRNLSISQICDKAIVAIHTIKQDYNSMIAEYDSVLSQRQENERRMEADFPDAIKNCEFAVWFQPKYDARTEKIVGAEALVRWNRNAGRIISPGEFIPVFERDGLISKLDEYVFRTVCKLQRERMDEGYELFPISINMSRNTIRHDDAVDKYISIIKEFDIPVKSVPIELTESAAFLNVQIKELTQKLKDEGFSIHMDDFGSGYSSLSSLNVLPFDEIKLDKGLIDFIGDKNGDLIIEAVITLTKKMGLSVVAEGVEEKYQLDFLRDLSCDTIQGYYFSKPLCYEEFIALVNKK